MKNFFLTWVILIVVFISIDLKAQITLNSADIASSGDRIEVATDLTTKGKTVAK